MIVAFNALLECLVTGFFTALILMGMSKLGWLPLMFITYDDPREQPQEFDDE